MMRLQLGRGSLLAEGEGTSPRREDNEGGQDEECANPSQGSSAVQSKPVTTSSDEKHFRETVPLRQGPRADLPLSGSATLTNKVSTTTTSMWSTVVFLRIPKAASTSIVTLFRERLECNGSVSFNFVVGGHNEALTLCGEDVAKLSDLRKLCSKGSQHSNDLDTSMLCSVAEGTRIGLGLAAFDSPSTFVFTFVRNPYERCVSSWMYCFAAGQRQRRQQQQREGAEVAGQRPLLDEGNEIDKATMDRNDFAEFLELLYSRGLYSDEWNWHERLHICEQLPHLLHARSDEQFGSDPSSHLAVDFVGRVERIETDVQALLVALGIDNENFSSPGKIVPHENMQQLRMNYRGYYASDRQRQLVFEIYRRDIEYFGYEF